MVTHTYGIVIPIAWLKHPVRRFSKRSAVECHIESLVLLWAQCVEGSLCISHRAESIVKTKPSRPVSIDKSDRGGSAYRLLDSKCPSCKACE